MIHPTDTSSLQVLSLRCYERHHVENSSFRDLADALSHCVSLRTLEIRFCFLGRQFTTINIIPLLNGLVVPSSGKPQREGLKEFVLTTMEYNVLHLDKASTLALAAALKSPNCKLETLELHETGLNEEAFMALISGAVSCSTLQNLSVQDRNCAIELSLDSWFSLSHTLASLRLTSLRLEGYIVDDDYPEDVKKRIRKAFLDGLKLNTHIVKASFNDEDIIETVQVEKVCIRNRAIKAGLGLRDGTFPASLAYTVLAAIEKDCKYCPGMTNNFDGLFATQIFSLLSGQPCAETMDALKGYLISTS